MNNKLRIYLDTSAVSYLDQHDAQEKMKITQEAWKELCSGKYEVVVSATLMEELLKCNDTKIGLFYDFLDSLPNIIFSHKTSKIKNVAELIINCNIVKSSSRTDAVHLAHALENNCDIMLSWDIKHLVNINTSNKIKQFCFLMKYKNILDIYTPEYLLSEEE